MTAPWDPDFANRSPLFEPLRAALAGLRAQTWPGYEELNRVLASASPALATPSGQPLRFVEQPPRQTAFEDQFEPRIFLRGEVQFRACNWHDLFNALVWITFPRAKAALNRRHFRELEGRRASGAHNRGPAQDALTLFDEGGLIVACADPALGELVCGYRWKELFWRRRLDVMQNMRFHVFGHAIYEKALEPFPGVTGRSVIFRVNESFFDLSPGKQLSELDIQLAERLDDPGQFLATRELAPLPILGVPGWCEANTQERYYDNTEYFRPPRATTTEPKNDS